MVNMFRFCTNLESILGKLDARQEYTLESVSVHQVIAQTLILISPIVYWNVFGSQEETGEAHTDTGRTSKTLNRL